MKTRGNTFSIFKTNRHLGLALLGCLLLQGAVSAAPAKFSPAQVVPPADLAYGKTYAEWSAAWWQWALELPVEGHPFLVSNDFDVRSGQSGDVWFLAAPFATPTTRQIQRTCTVPAGKALFVGLLNAEASDLEDMGETEGQQLETAAWFADHIVVESLSCTLDGVPIPNLGNYRVVSPQLHFYAPTPWMYGETGGAGTTVADGYYLMLQPLSIGVHKLHYSGTIHFDAGELGDGAEAADFVVNMTYHLKVN